MEKYKRDPHLEEQEKRVDYELRFWRAAMIRRFSNRLLAEVEEAIKRARAEISPSIDRSKLTQAVKRFLS